MTCLKSSIAVTAILMLSACATAEPVKITEIPVVDLSSDILTVIRTERSDFTIEEVLKKERDGRTYFDVEGEVSDGSELEFDILITDDGPQIVEIQRDVSFDDLNNELRAAILDAMTDIRPVRIIESVQTDGSVIYELFEAGKPTDPAHEIRVHAGRIEHLSERWTH